MFIISNSLTNPSTFYIESIKEFSDGKDLKQEEIDKINFIPFSFSLIVFLCYKLSLLNLDIKFWSS